MQWKCKATQGIIGRMCTVQVMPAQGQPNALHCNSNAKVSHGIEQELSPNGTKLPDPPPDSGRQCALLKGLSVALEVKRPHHYDCSKKHYCIANEGE